MCRAGIVAADTMFAKLTATEPSAESPALEVPEYETQLRSSWVFDELHAVRNVHPSYHWGRWIGMAYSGFTTMLTRGKEPWTFRNTKTDSQSTKKASEMPPIVYPKPDGVISFDLLTNLARRHVPYFRVDGICDC
jgi:electron-transferring-flavoprotein dehydrogenase